jgi:hypothetical protein
MHRQGSKITERTTEILRKDPNLVDVTASECQLYRACHLCAFVLLNHRYGQALRKRAIGAHVVRTTVSGAQIDRRPLPCYHRSKASGVVAASVKPDFHDREASAKGGKPEHLTDALRKCRCLVDARVCDVVVESSPTTILSEITRLRPSCDGEASVAGCKT